MGKPEFKVGMKVWAKMASYPPWPAKVRGAARCRRGRPLIIPQADGTRVPA